MQTMGASVIDVANEFHHKLVAFSETYPGVVDTAFVEAQGFRLRLTTLIAKDDNAAEDQLAEIELRLENAFREIPMTFSTIHLRGRTPEHFIPEEGGLVIFGSGASSRYRRADARGPVR